MNTYNHTLDHHKYDAQERLQRAEQARKASEQREKRNSDRKNK